MIEQPADKHKSQGLAGRSKSFSSNLQDSTDEPDAKRVKTDMKGPNDSNEPAGEGQNEEPVEGEAETPSTVPRMPICDLDTLQELEQIRGGCCICTLRSSSTVKP